jgi:hypothetical protein
VCSCALFQSWSDGLCPSIVTRCLHTAHHLPPCTSPSALTCAACQSLQFSAVCTAPSAGRIVACACVRVFVGYQHSHNTSHQHARFDTHTHGCVAKTPTTEVTLVDWPRVPLAHLLFFPLVPLPTFHRSTFAEDGIRMFFQVNVVSLPHVALRGRRIGTQ